MFSVVCASRDLFGCEGFASFPVTPSLFVDRSKRPLQWADLAEGRLRLDRLCGNGACATFFPCRLRRHSSRNNKAALAPSFAALRSQAMPRRSPSGPPIAIEAAMVRARGREERRIIMATIGTFKKSGNDYTGEIVTLSVQAKNVRIVPEANRTGDNSPSHRVMVGRVEIGAAWAKRSNEGRDYLGLKLGRSELHRSDLRQPLRRRGRRRVQPHLVPPQRPPHRRVKPVSKAPSGRTGWGLCAMPAPNRLTTRQQGVRPTTARDAGVYSQERLL